MSSTSKKIAAGPAIVNRSGRNRRSSMATSVSNIKSVSEKRTLPYWVMAVSKAEKFDPELGKFVADDKYNEEKDRDYVLPGSDIDVETEDDEEDLDELSELQKEAEDNLPLEILEGKYKEMKIVDPVKVTMSPSKEGEGVAKPTEEIITLETDDEEDGEKTDGKVVHPQLWEKCLMMTEQPEEYDSDEDPEYIPPPVILDTSFEYDEFFEEEEIISDNEVEMLKAEADKYLEPPRCYIPIWVPVESPSERIQRAKDELTATGTIEGLKEVSKSGEEKSADEGEKIEGVAPPKTPTKVDADEDFKSLMKKSPEKSSK